MKRKLFGMMLGLGVLASVVLSAPSAHATYTVTLENVGNNVVATGSGSINLNGFSTVYLNASVYTIIDPSASDMYLGGGAFNSLYGTSSGSSYYFSGIYGPTNFGSGTLKIANSVSGAFVGLDQQAQDMYLNLPGNYASGSALGTSTATWDSTTLSLLGVTTGTYTWSWGTGANADSFILYAGVDPTSSSPSATPEPSTWVLFGTGILALMGWTVRKKKALQS